MTAIREGMDLSCLEPGAAATIKPVFHSPSEARRLLGRPTKTLNGFLDFVARAVQSLTDPTAKQFHIGHLMPPPSYEYAWGLQLLPNDEYMLPLTMRRDGMLVLHVEARSKAEIRFGGKIVLVKRNANGRYVVDYGGAALRQDGAYLYLTMRHWRGRLWYAVNGEPLCDSDTLDFDPSVVVLCTRGKAFIVSAQTLDGNGRFLQFSSPYPGDERIVRVSAERNPFRFEWGLRSCTLLNMLIAIAVARDLQSALVGSHDVHLDGIRSRLRSLPAVDEALQVLLDQLLKWPFWRPAAGDYPESGAWDRNSFTNGTLPAIVAVLARLTNREADPEVLDRFHDRGTAFLNSAARSSFIAFAARNHDHWVRRSANHGLIMLSAYMVGAHLLNQTHRDDVRQIDRTFGIAIHRLLEDGSFCEGVAYEFFALSYLLPYIHLFGDTHAYDDDRSIGTLIPLLGKSYDWVSLNHDCNGAVFGNFGDNFTDKIRRISLYSYFQSCSDSRLEIPDRYAEWSDELFSFAPVPRFERSLGRRVESRFYPVNQTYLAAAYTLDGDRASGLFVIGSKLQRTHNKNHDCGGFSFYWGCDCVKISGSEESSHLNNSIGFMDSGKIVPHDGPRLYSGSVQEIFAADEEIRVEANVSPGRGFMKGRSRIEFTRIFTFRPYSSIPLTIESHITAPSHLQPFLAYQLQGFNRGKLGASKWCRTFLRADTAWMELSSQRIGHLCTCAGEPSPSGKTVFLTAFGEGEFDVSLVSVSDNL